MELTEQPTPMTRTAYILPLIEEVDNMDATTATNLKISLEKYLDSLTELCRKKSYGRMSQTKK